MSQSIQLTGGLSVEGTPEVFLYVSGLEINPDAVLLVSRMNLAKGYELKTMDDLQRYALANMNRSHTDFDQLAEEEGFTTRELSVGTLSALEIINDGKAGSPGEPEIATRGLTVLGGDFVLVVVMLNLDGGDASTSLLWDHMVASLHVDPTGLTVGKIVTGAAIVLGLFALFLFSRRMYLARRYPTHEWEASAASTDTSASKEGWGHQASAGAYRPEEPAQAQTTLAVARTLPSSPAARPTPPGATRTLPCSPPRTLPSSPPRTLPSSPPRTLPSSPPRTLPSAPARAASETPAAPEPVAAAQLHETRPGSAGGPGGGLKRTLPASGQWSRSA